MRYCTICGARLTEGARFCTSCGVRIGAAPADVGAPTGAAGPERTVVPGRAAASEWVDSGRVAVPGRAAAPSASTNPVAQPLEGGPEAPVDGGRPAGLGARIVQFRRTALAAVPTWALAMLALLLAAGTAYAAYRVVADLVLPALEQAQSEDEEAAEEATEDVEATEEEVAEEEATQTDEQVMYQLYYEKCLEYIELYGEPSIREASSEVTSLAGSWVYGLAVAQLLDFNDDGTDELLLIYSADLELFTSEDFDYRISSADHTELYRIEVWSYSGGELTLSYSDWATGSDGIGFCYLYRYEGRLCIYNSYDGEYSDEYDDAYDEVWFLRAMGDDGKFEAVLGCALTITGSSRTYSTLDGAEATASDFYAMESAMESLELVQIYSLYSIPANESVSTLLMADDIVALTNETLAQLKAGV